MINIKTSFTDLGLITGEKNVRSYGGQQSPSHFLEIIKLAIDKGAMYYDEDSKILYLHWDEEDLYFQFDMSNVLVRGKASDNAFKIVIE